MLDTPPNTTVYVCYREFPKHGPEWAQAGDLTNFQDACDDYERAMDEGAAACVKSINLATNDMQDVTKDALDRLFYIWRETHVDAPAWAMEAA